MNIFTIIYNILSMNCNILQASQWGITMHKTGRSAAVDQGRNDIHAGMWEVKSSAHNAA